jgi:hypothetical protein
VALDWVAPAECARELDVLEALRSRLIGKSLPPSEPFDANARIEPTETGYTLTLRVRFGDEAGTRVLAAEDCSELGAAAAIILALALEGAEPLPPTEPEPSAPAEPPSEPEDGPDASPAAPIAFAPHLRFRAALLGDLGALPEPALGGSVEVGYPIDAFEIWAGALLLLPSSVQLKGRSEPVAELSILGGRIAASWLPLAQGDFRAGPTLAFEVGRVGGSGQNVLDEAAGHGLWLAGLVGLEARLIVSRWVGFSAEIAVGLPARHVAFTVESLGTVHEISSPFGRARVGLVLGF